LCAWERSSMGFFGALDVLRVRPSSADLNRRTPEINRLTGLDLAAHETGSPQRSVVFLAPFGPRTTCPLHRLGAQRRNEERRRTPAGRSVSNTRNAKERPGVEWSGGAAVTWVIRRFPMPPQCRRRWQNCDKILERRIPHLVYDCASLAEGDFVDDLAPYFPQC
jgi:hypothetical protein